MVKKYLKLKRWAEKDASEWFWRVTIAVDYYYVRGWGSAGNNSSRGCHNRLYTQKARTERETEGPELGRSSKEDPNESVNIYKSWMSRTFLSEIKL